MNPYAAWPRSARVAVILFILISSGFILKNAQALLVPIVLAILVAFLLHPLVKRLQRYGINRVLGTVMVVAIVTVAASGIGFVVSRQIKMLADDLPNHRGNIEQRVLVLKRFLRGGTIDRLQQTIERINRRTERQVEKEKPRDIVEGPEAEVAEGSVESPEASVPPEPAAETGDAKQPPTKVEVQQVEPSNPLLGSPILGSVMEFFAAAGVVVLLVIFFLIQQGDIRDRLVAVTGRGGLATTTKALEDAGARISRFLLMQFLINGSFGLAVCIGLALMQVPYAIMWGLCAGLFRYVPYIGPWVAAALPILTSLILSTGWTQPLMVLGLFLVLELLSNNVMEPILYGHSVGLSSVGVILAAIIWGWIWGPIGLVLATPMTVCLVVLGKYVPGLRIFDLLLGERPPVGPAMRLYQRLLAKDEEDAEDLIEEFLESKSIAEACDQLLLPVVELMRQDQMAQQIDDEDADWIMTALTNLLNELPEDEAPQAEPEGEAEQAESWPVVVGLPAHTAAEELALKIVGRAVSELSCRFEVMSSDLLLSERVSELVKRRPVAVCVSALPPGDLANSRQVCKRVRQQLPQIKLVVGRWSQSSARDRNEQLRQSGADEVVSTIAEMSRAIRSTVQLHRAPKAAAPEPVTAVAG